MEDFGLRILKKSRQRVGGSRQKESNEELEFRSQEINRLALICFSTGFWLLTTGYYKLVIESQ